MTPNEFERFAQKRMSESMSEYFEVSLKKKAPGDFPKKTIMALFPVLVNSIEGFPATDSGRLELMRSLNASRWQTFRLGRRPGALPFVYAASSWPWSRACSAPSSAS